MKREIIVSNDTGWRPTLTRSTISFSIKKLQHTFEFHIKTVCSQELNQRKNEKRDRCSVILFIGTIERNMRVGKNCW